MAQTIVMDQVSTEKSEKLSNLIHKTNEASLALNDRYIGCDYNAAYIDGYANFEKLIEITSGKLIGKVQGMEMGLDDNYLPYSISLQDSKFGPAHLVVLQSLALDLATYVAYVDNNELKEIVQNHINLVRNFVNGVTHINAER